MKICITILYCDLNGFWFLRGKLQKSAKKKKTERKSSTKKSTSSLFSSRKKPSQPSLWSLWFPPLFTPDLLCAKILWFSIETRPFRGDIDVFFLAGVMIWWIRISKPGTILAFMLVFFLCAFCRVLSPCSNPHFSNEYKYLFCECLSSSHFGCFSTIKVFVGAAGCNAETLQSGDAKTGLSLSPLHSLSDLTCPSF